MKQSKQKARIEKSQSMSSNYTRHHLVMIGLATALISSSTVAYDLAGSIVPIDSGLIRPAQPIIANPLQLRMPDLRPTGIRTRTWFGTQVNFYVEIVNDGTMAAPATELALTFSLINSANQTVELTQNYNFTTPSLAVGQRTEVFAGNTELTNRIEDWDLSFLAKADFLTGSAKGNVRETNENNNQMTY